MSLTLALLLDALIGEPRWIWRRIAHPVVLIGRLIAWFEQRWNRGRRLEGILLVSGLVTASLVLATAIAALPGGEIWSVLVAAVFLAQRSLVEHAVAVADGLDVGIVDGRRAVAAIVGRDVETLDEAGVARAAIESTAENFSDGVVAPAFWMMVAGLPGLLAYKAVNTADSMIGHKDDRHLAFGWAAARLDDLLNFMPSRLSGALLAGLDRRIWRVMLRDAQLHESPNAGWPEAAMAARLGVALAGPRSYAGALVEGSWMNGEGREAASAADIRLAVRAVWRAWTVLVAAAALISIALWP